MPITPLNGALTAGIAGQYSETINPEPAGLITGDVPAYFTESVLLPTNLVLAANTVVGIDANGRVVAAQADGDPKALGILAYAVDTTGIANDLRSAEVIRGGCFNPDMLVWDASFNTDALRFVAFRGAPTPTQIILRRPVAMSV